MSLEIILLFLILGGEKQVFSFILGDLVAMKLRNGHLANQTFY